MERHLQLLLQHFRKYLELTSATEIARRYLVMNGFDGSLAILGVVLGSSVLGRGEPRVIFSAGLGAALALGVSGAWGAYAAEKAERERRLRELERALFTELTNSILRTASNVAVAFIVLVNALSPILFSLITLTPFLLAMRGLIGGGDALAAAIAANLATLYLLGFIIGRIGRTSALKQGAFMVLAGVVIALLVLFIESVF